MMIGLYLKRADWRDPNVASDRIRGEWVMKCHPYGFEEWQSGRDYIAVVFHNPVPLIAKTSGVKLLDVCDPMWSDVGEFRHLTSTVDGIVTATDELARQVQKLGLNKPVRVIGDGHWFPFYETRLPNPHTTRAELAVWFGYADNAFALRPLLPALAARKLTLKLIAERNPFQLESCMSFVPWRRDSFVREISLCDFAVLPPTQPYKSNNKDISALLAGIPVAKDEAGIARLMDPAERQKDMEQAPEIIARHDVHDRAREYLDWVRELWASKAK